MAPMKLEDNMKDRLEERRIVPTAAAWDRISSKLENEKGKKTSTIVLWSAIAASFVGGALITLFVLNNEAPLENSRFVEIPQEEIIKSEERVNPQTTDDIIKDTRNIEVTQVDKMEQSSTSASKESETPTVNKLQKRNTQMAIAENKSNTSMSNKNKELIVEDKTQEATVTENVKSKNIQKSLMPKDVIDTKIKQMITQVDLNAVTDAEVDSLLKNAQREIISASIFNEQSNKVDANALLLDVEAEIDPETFKDKVFGILKEGFYTARDAVADRNN